MHEYCKNNIKGISFFHITKSDIDKLRNQMSERLQNATTVPGTRSMHYFEPTGQLSISGKRISDDTEFSGLASFESGQNINLDIPSPNTLVACVYHTNWFLGFIPDVHLEDGDVTVKFIHPHGPSISYYWPENDSYCIVPFTHILCAVDMEPIIGGRTYKVNDASSTLVNSTPSQKSIRV